MEAVKLILLHEILGKYFMILRDDKPDIPAPNCWDIIGGGIEQGESPEEALLREFREEVGSIELCSLEKLMVYEGVTFPAGKPVSSPIHIFRASTRSDPRDAKVFEGQRGDYFTVDEVLSLPTVPRLKEFVAQYRDLL